MPGPAMAAGARATNGAVTAELVQVCLACRTAYPAGWACAGGAGHEVVVLADPDDRERLTCAVWGDPEDRRRTRARIVAERRRLEGMVGGFAAAGLAGAAMFGAGALAAFGVAGGGVVGGLVAAVTRSRAPAPFPAAALERPWPAVTARGRIRGAAPLIAPASGEPCAAWSVQLRFDGAWGERVMLRAGATAGLEILLEDRELVRVDAGPVALAGAPPQVEDPNAAGIEDLLRELDPLRRVEPWSPVPYNVVGEDFLFVGDRVELRGALEPSIAAGGTPTYREAPATVLAPRGLLGLRRIG
jgi:hypothetical protein